MDQDWFTEVSWTSPHLVHILDCKWNRQVLLQTSRLLAIRIVHNSEDGTQVSLQFLRPPWTSVFKLYHECHTPIDIQVKPPSFILHLSESSGHNWPSMLVKGWAPQWVWPHPCLLPWTPGFISISEVLLGSWFMILKKYLSTQPKHTQILSPRFSPIYDLEKSVGLRWLFDHRR